MIKYKTVSVLNAAAHTMKMNSSLHYYSNILGNRSRQPYAHKVSQYHNIKLGEDPSNKG